MADILRATTGAIAAGVGVAAVVQNTGAALGAAGSFFGGAPGGLTHPRSRPAGALRSGGYARGSADEDSVYQ